jgi:hypothetical protein
MLALYLPSVYLGNVAIAPIDRDFEGALYPTVSTTDSPSHALDNLHLRFRADSLQLQPLHFQLRHDMCLASNGPGIFHKTLVRLEFRFMITAIQVSTAFASRFEETGWPQDLRE